MILSAGFAGTHGKRKAERKYTMPTKLKRYTISANSDLSDLIEKEARATRRGYSNLILWILDQYFAGKLPHTDVQERWGAGGAKHK
jgi:hypothetical protein